MPGLRELQRMGDDGAHVAVSDSRDKMQISPTSADISTRIIGRQVVLLHRGGGGDLLGLAVNSVTPVYLLFAVVSKDDVGKEKVSSVSEYDKRISH